MIKIAKNSKNYKYKQMQIFNLLGFMAMLTVNYLANALPINNMTVGEVSGKFSNIFVPAGYAFSIWGLIYLLLGIFAVYQAKGLVKKDGKKLLYVEKISYLFFISCLLNSGWIFAWLYLRIGLSLIVMIALLINLILIYKKLQDPAVKEERLGSLVRCAFSIYLGWITIATVANVSAFLISIGWGRLGLSEAFWMVMVLIIATAIVLSVIFKYRDWLYGLVAVWAFLAIIVARLRDDPVDILVVVSTAICLVIIINSTVRIIAKKRGVL